MKKYRLTNAFFRFVLPKQVGGFFKWLYSNDTWRVHKRQIKRVRRLIGVEYVQLYTRI